VDGELSLARTLLANDSFVTRAGGVPVPAVQRLPRTMTVPSSASRLLTGHLA
jgi:hypothetical protein